MDANLREQNLTRGRKGDRECTRMDPPTQSLRRDKQRTINESADGPAVVRQPPGSRRTMAGRLQIYADMG
jgi:hypothetical protein